MAVNKSRVPGLRKWSVQEALNQHLGATIRVFPTLDSGGAYSAGDMLFATTEIPNAVAVAGGTSRLIGLSIVDYEEQDPDMQIVFMQNQYDLSTTGIHEAVNMTDANAEAMKFLGMFTVDWSDATLDVGDANVYTSPGSAGDSPIFPIILQATSNSTSVYFGARATSTPNFSATDDLEFIFHIEYR
jgi:hypothetical protein